MRCFTSGVCQSSTSVGQLCSWSATHRIELRYFRFWCSRHYTKKSELRYFRFQITRGVCQSSTSVGRLCSRSTTYRIELRYFRFQTTRGVCQISTGVYNLQNSVEIFHEWCRSGCNLLLSVVSCQTKSGILNAILSAHTQLLCQVCDCL